MLFLFLGWLQTLLMIYCEQLKYICFGEIILNHKVFISIWETIGMFEAWFVWFCGENKRILFCCCETPARNWKWCSKRPNLKMAIRSSSPIRTTISTDFGWVKKWAPRSPRSIGWPGDYCKTCFVCWLAWLKKRFSHKRWNVQLKPIPGIQKNVWHFWFSAHETKKLPKSIQDAASLPTNRAGSSRNSWRWWWGDVWLKTRSFTHTKHPWDRYKCRFNMDGFDLGESVK